MPSTVPRAALAASGALAVLLVAALLARGASAALLSPLPGAGMFVAMAGWFAVGGVLLWVLAPLEIPRLARRLLVLAVLASSGWGIGTLVRATWVTLAFATAGSVTPEPSVWRLGMASGGAASASSQAHPRGVSVPLDAGAVRAMKPFATCVTLTLERTDAGVVRVRVPDAPLTAADLAPCGGPATAHDGG